MTFQWVAGRPYAPQGALWDRALAHWRTLRTDEHAVFDREHGVNCSTLEPQITWGTDPSMVLGISGRVPDPSSAADQGRKAAMQSALTYMGLTPGMALEGLPVNRVFIGSCTNARLPDLQVAADIVRGRRVAQGVIAMVVPGSSTVKRDAEAAGLDRVFRDAGFFWGESGCSMCAGGNGDRGEPGERIVSTTNRNFEHRQGTKVRTHLVSPATAAATRDRRPHRRRAAIRGTSLMQPFSSHTGIAVPLLVDDLNTDQIAPVQAMRDLKPDYRKLLFMRTRAEEPDFVLNQPQFRNPGILVSGNNFGAGSSREAAVWGMLANNIRVIVAKSFADIYRENCLQNGLLPVVLPQPEADDFIARVVAVNGAAPFTVDLPTQKHQRPGRARCRLQHPGRQGRGCWKVSTTSG